MTVTKKELRSSAGLGRLTDPSVWAELEALYSNCQNMVTWVRTSQAAKISPGTSGETGTPFTDTTMGEVEWINRDLTMQRWTPLSDVLFLTQTANCLHVYSRSHCAGTVPERRLIVPT